MTLLAPKYGCPEARVIINTASNTATSVLYLFYNSGSDEKGKVEHMIAFLCFIINYHRRYAIKNKKGLLFFRPHRVMHIA